MTTNLRPPSAAGESAYDAYYYRHSCGLPYERNATWLELFGRIADRIVRDIGPRRVLDAGCAVGLLVETLRQRGVEAFGVDISTYAIGEVHESVRPFCSVASLTDDFDGQYDLIVCIEVLEHLDAAAAERAIDNMCRHTTDVLFSSTPLDYKEATHVNVRQPDYWVERFGSHGFFRDVDFDAAFVTPWAIRFRKRSDPSHRIAMDYERRLWEVMTERNELRAQNVELHQQLKAAARNPVWRRVRPILGRIRRAAGL